jgi:hypothetical protein
MGRPLAKRFFGNRNIGSASTTADDNLGGKRVASVTLGTLGAYTTRPTVTFSTPDLTGVGAVRATGTVTSEVLSAAISGAQTRAYPVAAGAIGFNTGGTTFTAAVTSSALTNVVRASATTIGFDTTTVAMISGTSIHITGASITGTLSIGGVPIAAGQIYYVGAPTSATAATLYANYADAVAATNPLTIVAGTGVTGATFTRGVTFGTVTALTVVARGSYEALVASGPAVVETAGVGAGLVITPTYRAKAVVITEPGSGYTNATDAAPTFTQSVTGTTVLEVDSGYTNNTTNAVGNNENAIVIRAKTTSGGTVQVGDIQSQKGSHRYKVKTANGTAVCKLVTTTSAAVNQGYILATDITGNEYFVTKITSRKCVITRKSGGSNYEFADPATYPSGQVVKWTLGTQVLNSSVKIENA